MCTRSSKSLIALGTIATGILITNSLCNKRHRDNIQKTEWLSWEINVKEGTSESGKAKIINKIEKQIIDHLYSQNLNGIIVKSIEFNFSDYEYRHIRLKVIVRYVFLGKDAVIVFPPAPHPPLDEIFKDVSPSIENIKDIGINAKFNS